MAKTFTRREIAAALQASLKPPMSYPPSPPEQYTYTNNKVDAASRVVMETLHPDTVVSRSLTRHDLAEAICILDEIGFQASQGSEPLRKSMRSRGITQVALNDTEAILVSQAADENTV